MRPPRARSLARAVAALVAPLVLGSAGCGGGDDAGGVEVTIVTAAIAPQPAALRVSWWNDASALILDRSERVAPVGQGEDTRLAVIRVRVEGAPARRWVVVRGMGENSDAVSEGAAIVDAEPGAWVPLVVRLWPGVLPDDDRDGVPDTVDECRGDRTRHAGCAADAGPRADARDGARDSEPGGSMDAPDAPDATAPDATADVPDVAPDAPVDGRADTAPRADATDATDAPDAISGDASDAAPDLGADAPDATADAPPPCKALLAVEKTGEAPDMAVQMRLQTLACAVTVKQESTLVEADVAGHTMVVVAPSAGSSPAYMWLRTRAVPVLVLEDRALGELRMTGTTEGTHTGEAPLQTAVDVVAASPFAGGLSGKQTVIDMASDINWGVPPAGAIAGATVTGVPAQLVVFGFETNAMMVEIKAPARRAAYLMEETAITRLNANGWKLFDAAVRWLQGP